MGNLDTQRAPSTMGSLAAAVMNPEEQAKIRLKRRVEDSQADLGETYDDTDETVEFLR